VFGFDVGDIAGVLHLYVMRRRPAPPAFHGFHFILPKQELDAFGVFIDDALLAGQHRGPIDLDIGNLNAEFAGVLESFVEFGVVQQDLGWNASDVKARAAQKAVFLDDQRL